MIHVVNLGPLDYLFPLAGTGFPGTKIDVPDVSQQRG